MCCSLRELPQMSGTGRGVSSCPCSKTSIPLPLAFFSFVFSSILSSGLTFTRAPISPFILMSKLSQMYNVSPSQLSRPTSLSLSHILVLFLIPPSQTTHSSKTPHFHSNSSRWLQFIQRPTLNKSSHSMHPLTLSTSTLSYSHPIIKTEQP